MRIKSKFAAALTALCTASLLSVPAHAVSWSGDDGWEVHYTGFINLFYNQLDFSPNDGGGVRDAMGNASRGVDEDSSLLNQGLLPSFHTMKAKSPTINGLTGTSQITFAIDTSTDKAVHLNKSSGDDLIDLREVFFNVEGSFGTISVGRTLALYQRQAILKDMTLFGVGGMADPDSNGTALGRIGAGYVYPDFRARFLWQSPDLHGLQLSLGVFQPREHYSGINRSTNYEGVLTGAINNANSATPVADTFDPAIMTVTGTNTVRETTSRVETDIPMFQGEMTFNFDQNGLEALFWAGFLWQEAEINTTRTKNSVTATVSGVRNSNGTTTVDTTTVSTNSSNAVETSSDEVRSFGWNVGTQMNFAGFGLTGSYYRGNGLGTLFLQTGGVGCLDNTVNNRLKLECGEATVHGGYIQGTYTFDHGGDSKTMLGVSWGYSSVENDRFVHGNTVNQALERDSDGNVRERDTTYTNQGITGGVYHDVNSWLRVIGEYNTYEYEHTLNQEVEGFSVGAFMFW